MSKRQRNHVAATRPLKVTEVIEEDHRPDKAPVYVVHHAGRSTTAPQPSTQATTATSRNDVNRDDADDGTESGSAAGRATRKARGPRPLVDSKLQQVAVDLSYMTAGDGALVKSGATTATVTRPAVSKYLDNRLETVDDRAYTVPVFDEAAGTLVASSTKASAGHQAQWRRGHGETLVDAAHEQAMMQGRMDSAHVDGWGAVQSGDAVASVKHAGLSTSQKRRRAHQKRKKRHDGGVVVQESMKKRKQKGLSAIPVKHVVERGGWAADDAAEIGVWVVDDASAGQEAKSKGIKAAREGVVVPSSIIGERHAVASNGYAPGIMRHKSMRIAQSYLPQVETDGHALSVNPEPEAHTAELEKVLKPVIASIARRKHEQAFLRKQSQKMKDLVGVRGDVWAFSMSVVTTCVCGSVRCQLRVVRV